MTLRLRLCIPPSGVAASPQLDEGTIVIGFHIEHPSLCSIMQDKSFTAESPTYVSFSAEKLAPLPKTPILSASRDMTQRLVEGFDKTGFKKPLPPTVRISSAHQSSIFLDQILQHSL